MSFNGLGSGEPAFGIKDKDKALRFFGEALKVNHTITRVTFRDIGPQPKGAGQGGGEACGAR